MKNTNPTNFKEKCLLFKKMGIEYKRAKILTTKMYASFSSYNLINEDSTNYLPISQEKISYYENVVKILDMALNSIKKDYSIILTNDFFETKEENWWLYYYSRSTYYRLKNNAMESFLELFNVN